MRALSSETIALDTGQVFSIVAAPILFSPYRKPPQILLPSASTTSDKSSEVTTAALPASSTVGVPTLAFIFAAYGVNDHGEIVGYVPNSSSNSGYVYSNGVYTAFSVPGATSTFPTGVNNAGDIAGTYRVGTSGIGLLGFLYSDGAYTTLNVPGSLYTDAWGVNGKDQITGDYADDRGVHGFVYSNGVYTTLSGPPLTDLTYAQGINDAGEIVGQYYNPLANGFLATPVQGVPEPSAWGMILIGFVGLGFVACRRQKPTGQRPQALIGRVAGPQDCRVRDCYRLAATPCGRHANEGFLGHADSLPIVQPLTL